MYEWSAWSISLFVFLGLMIIVNVTLCFAFAVGGFYDIIYLLKSLKESVVDETDDGRVAE